MESGLRLERMQMLRLERVVESCDAEILAVRGRPERRAVKKLGVDGLRLMRQARPVAELIVEVRQPVIPDAGGQERACAERPRVIDKHRPIATSDIGNTQAHRGAMAGTMDW